MKKCKPFWKTKKAIAVLLSVLVLFGVLPVSSMASDRHIAKTSAERSNASLGATVDEVKTGETTEDSPITINVTHEKNVNEYINTAKNITWYNGDVVFEVGIDTSKINSTLKSIQDLNLEFGENEVKKEDCLCHCENDKEGHELSETCYSKITQDDKITFSSDKVTSKSGRFEFKVTVTGDKDEDKKITKSAVVYFDTSVPKIEEITFDNKQLTKDNVTVSFKSNKLSGIKSVVVKKQNEDNEINCINFVVSNENWFKFVATSSGYYDVSVTDYFNKVVNDTIIVTNIDKAPPEIKIQGYSIDEGKSFTKTVGWANKNVTVKFKVTDEKSGVEKVSVLKPNDENVICGLSGNEENTYTFTAEQYGTYTIKASDKAGNNAELDTVNLQIDKDDPEINNVTFKSAATTTQKFLTALTFGIYHNDNIKVIVNAADNKTDNQSGIASVVLKDNKGKAISGSKKENECYVFELNKSDSPYDLSVCVTDTAGNTVEKSIRDIEKSAEIEGENQQATIVQLGTTPSEFEVVYTDQAPTVTITPTENDGTNHYTKNLADDSQQEWYNGDVTFSIKAEDKLSGIKSIEAKLDDKEVTLENLENFEAKKVTENTVSYTTSDISEGEHTLDVTVINNSGNTTFETSKIFIDYTAPESTSFHFESASSAKDKLFTALTFGIYHNNDVNVTVTAEDEKVDGYCVGTAGEKSDIVLENSEKTGTISVLKTIKNNGEISKTFTLKCGGKNDINYKYLLSASATDSLGNSSDKYSINNNEIKVTAETDKSTADEITNRSDGFEVVATKQPATVKITPTENDGTKHYTKKLNDGLQQEWYNGDVKFTVNVNDKVSGIKSISVLLNSSIVTKDCIGLPENYTGEKITSTEFTYTTSKIPEGVYTLAVTVINNSGKTTTETSKIYIDKTAPKITSFHFESAATEGQKILTALTFGIYHNNDVNVTVTAEDKKVYGNCVGTAGEKSDIVLENSEKAGTISVLKTIKNNGEISKTFTLKCGNKTDADEFRYILSASATDSLGNDSGKIALEKASEKGIEVIADTQDPSQSDVNPATGFEVVATQKKPTIESIKSEPKDTEVNEFEKSVRKNENEEIQKWYNGDVTFKVEVKDKFSGIKSIEAKLDDKEVTLENLENFEAKKVTENTVSYTTSDISEGEHTLDVTVINNSGNTTFETSKIFIDYTAPKITSFDFGYVKYANDDKPMVAGDVEKTTYGYYFKKDTIVTVAASDGLGSGVKKILFESKDVNGSEISQEKPISEDSTAYFVVKANFKGQINAKAVDNLEKEGVKKYPDGLIIENTEKHSNNSSIHFSKEKSGKTDDNGLLLYNKDVPVSIIVKDTYSGIRNIKIEVTSDSKDKITKEVSVHNDCSVKSDNDLTCDIKSKNSNLITEMKIGYIVGVNSNNIEVKCTLTDRAGNVSEKSDKFSIDKTSPTITVSYDNNVKNTANGRDYFKADRTAKITVTERNFNENDVNIRIVDLDNGSSTVSIPVSWDRLDNNNSNDETTHTGTINFTENRNYAFDISFTDMAGNAANKIETQRFTIDKINPEINVSFDNNSSLNGNYFKAARVATVTVKEHNFNPNDVKYNFSVTAADNHTQTSNPSVSSWSSNGDTHTQTISFPNDGKFAFTVDVTDFALNNAEQKKVDTFYIDKTLPKIIFGGVENNSANNSTVQPTIRFEDYNFTFSSVKIEINRVDVNARINDASKRFTYVVTNQSEIGQTLVYNDLPHIEENDGIYTINVTAVDKAGNKFAATRTFSVNRFGSTYSYGNEPTSELIETGYSNTEEDVVISEINVDNLSQKKITLSRSNADSSVLNEDKDYTVKENGSSEHWKKYDYVIKKSNFEKEGNYVITLDSVDLAKNKNKSNVGSNNHSIEVSFTIDKTAPTVSLSGIENDEPIPQQSKTVNIVVEDANLDKNSFEVLLDGKKLTPEINKADSDASTIVATVSVSADTKISKQNLIVKAKDLAQNITEDGRSGFKLNAQWYDLLFANVPLMIMLGCALAAAVGLIVFLIIKKKSKRDK